MKKSCCNWSWLCRLRNCNCYSKFKTKVSRIWTRSKKFTRIKRINSLNNCRFPFQTNDVKLKKRFKKSCEIKKKFFSLYDKNIISDADIVLVNINFDILKKKNRKTFDLDPFKNTINDIASRIKVNTLVIINSTVHQVAAKKLFYRY